MPWAQHGPFRLEAMTHFKGITLKGFKGERSSDVICAVLAQAQHADLGRERERLQAALAERQSASVAAAAPAPDASVEALLEAVRTLLPLIVCQSSHTPL